jgi:hypothetical protein
MSFDFLEQWHGRKKKPGNIAIMEDECHAFLKNLEKKMLSQGD